jgi:spore maturation protein CgeB
MTTRIAEDWQERLRDLPRSDSVELVAGRGGKSTLRVRGLLLHSQYNPEQEAQRLIGAADLAPGAPVAVFGLGLGYHVRALLDAGHDVLVIEPCADTAALALHEGTARAGYLLCMGALDNAAEARAFLQRKPAFLAHPATARLHPEAATAAENAIAAAALHGQRLNIAIVGPMYGGSAPITGYLVNGFRKLGHNAIHIDNTGGWELYQRITGSIKDKHASGQLGQLFTNVLNEWTYARTAEFDPEICIVMAQAPVNNSFPARLAKNGTITAFWYVENWRHMRYWDSVAPAYDAFFHIQPGEFEEKLDAIGCKHHAFVQTGCDPDVHRPVTLSQEEQDEFGCDISFAGAGYYNRLQLFRGLTDYRFKIWGVDWHDRELARRVQGGEQRFENETFMKIAAGTKINLNLHSSNAHEGVDPRCDAINPRVFEIAAAGAFQLCDPCIGLERCFDFAAELPVYRDLKELRARIDHFLAHPDERKAFAARARERALRDHTYEHRAQEMLDHLLAWHAPRIQKRGVRVQRTVAETIARLPGDSELRGYLETLPGELLFNQEAMNAVLRPPMAGLTRPEQLFCYMREVRNFTEALLGAPR